MCSAKRLTPFFMSNDINRSNRNEYPPPRPRMDAPPPPPPHPSSELYRDILLLWNQDTELHAEHPMVYHSESPRLAVIIDPRYDTLMEAVIRQCMFFMNPAGWNLCVFSYRGHEEAVKRAFPYAIFRPIPDSMIYFDDQHHPQMTIRHYNRLLTSVEFYESLPAERIAIFQKDCILYRPIPDYFSKYYDFAGANWYVLSDNRTLFDGINGGFSLRNRSAMIDCIRRVSYAQIRESFPYMCITRHEEGDAIDADDDSRGMNEDVFFTGACELLRKTIPDKIHRRFLAIEMDQQVNTCVYHGWNKNYHSFEMAVELLKRSPLFWRYFPPSVGADPSFVMQYTID